MAGAGPQAVGRHRGHLRGDMEDVCLAAVEEPNLQPTGTATAIPGEVEERDIYIFNIYILYIPSCLKCWLVIITSPSLEGGTPRVPSQDFFLVN